MNTTLLARVPFLADVPADRLRADLPLLQPFSVGPDEVLIQEGEVDDALLIILEGSVQVEVGDPALVVAEELDDRAPPERVRELFDRMPQHVGTKELLVVPGVGHGKAFRDAPALYESALGDLLDRLRR